MSQCAFKQAAASICPPPPACSQTTGEPRLPLACRARAYLAVCQLPAVGSQHATQAVAWAHHDAWQRQSVGQLGQEGWSGVANTGKDGFNASQTRRGADSHYCPSTTRRCCSARQLPGSCAAYVCQGVARTPWLPTSARPSLRGHRGLWDTTVHFAVHAINVLCSQLGVSAAKRQGLNAAANTVLHTHGQVRRCACCHLPGDAIALAVACGSPTLPP